MVEYRMKIDQCGVYGFIEYRKSDNNCIVVIGFELECENNSFDSYSFITGVFCQWDEHVEFVTFN